VSKYLIVNGDDFGYSPGVSDGIVEAHEHGILTSTSMLVGTRFGAAAAQRARALPDLSVGLHVCLTDTGERFTVNPDDTKSCRSELRRQFDRFVELMETAPTHLDSHHNVHRDPRLEPLFLELAEEHSLPLREHSVVRYFPSFYGQWKGETHLEQIGAEMLERMLRTEIAEGLTELGCHPGYVDEHLDSSYSLERETELHTLCAPSVRPVLDELAIRLISFRDLPALVS
jgi:predicted glycoside hydrolase/deacetylase ChbG (UPF0249 family)